MRRLLISRSTCMSRWQLIRWLPLLAVHVQVPAAAAFASCPPPRFDSFADALTGKWQYGPLIPDQTDEVEEVMRSCGGAVQGVREIPLSDQLLGNSSEATGRNIDIEGRYHNRADDGFIFFDCGSYSTGPVQLTNDLTLEMMSNLAFPSMPRRRLLISTSRQVSYDDDGTILSLGIEPGGDNTRIVGLNRVPFRASTSAGEGGAVAVTDSDRFVDTTTGSIHWQKESICKMSSPTQPWMLQRAKWECFVSEDWDEGTTTSSEESDEKAGREDLVGWVAVRGKDDENTNGDIKLWTSSELDFLDPSKNNGEVVIQISALCQVTKQARAVIRSYDAKGKLNGVVLQEGTCITLK